MVSASSTAACTLLVSKDVAFCSAVSAKCWHLEEVAVARGTDRPDLYFAFSGKRRKQAEPGHA